MEEALDFSSSRMSSLYGLPPPPPPTTEQLAAAPTRRGSANGSIHDSKGDPDSSKEPSSVRRFLIINSYPSHWRNGKPPVALNLDGGEEEDVEAEPVVVDPARALLSHDREVQLAWLALFRAMKKKHLRVRDLFEKLDADGGDSLDYNEFKNGIEAFEALHEELPSARSVEGLVRSLFPDGDSEVNWEIFDRLCTIYPASHYPVGSFGEWAGRQLLHLRRVSLAQKKEIADLSEEKTQLLRLIDDLRVKEAKGEECAQALAAARSQLGSMVRLRDELLRAHNAMGAMKRELDRRNADLESLVASHQENLENTGTDLKDTGSALNEALQLKATLEEEVRVLRQEAARDAMSIQSLETRLQIAHTSLGGSDKQVSEMAENADRHAQEIAALMKAKHGVEMRVLTLETQLKEATSQVFMQRCVYSGSEGPPWWQRKIESLQAENDALSKADSDKANELSSLRARLEESERARMTAEALADSRERALNDTTALLERSKRQDTLAEKARADAIKEKALQRWA